MAQPQRPDIAVQREWRSKVKLPDKARKGVWIREAKNQTDSPLRCLVKDAFGQTYKHPLIPIVRPRESIQGLTGLQDQRGGLESVGNDRVVPGQPVLSLSCLRLIQYRILEDYSGTPIPSAFG